MEKEGKPFVSFIIPVYNAVPYIERCLRSVLQQTYQNFEVICVDDGSTDGTGEILENYSSINQRFRVIHQKNSGLVHARKVGVAQATGDYVSYVDADDKIALTRCEELLPAMATGADMILADIVQVYGDGYQHKQENFLAEGFYNRTDIEKKVLSCLMDEEQVFRQLVRNSISGGVFKRGHFKKCLSEVDNCISIGEGCAAITSCLLAAQSMYVVHSGIYYYYKNNGSMCHRINKDQALAKQRRSSFALFRHLRSIADRAPSDIGETLDRQMTLLAYNNLLLHDYELFNGVAKHSIFPFGVPICARIVLYGAGALGAQIHHYLARHGGQIVIWCDRSYKKHQANGLTVVSPMAIRDVVYDYILIAIGQYELAAEAKQELITSYGEDIAAKIKLIDPAELTSERLEQALECLKIEVAELSQSESTAIQA